MKTVFYINCADFGSTGKIIRCTAAEAKNQGWRSLLCAATLREQDPVFHRQFTVSCRLRRALTYRFSRLTGNKFGQSHLPTAQLLRQLRKEKPDVVHIHCANGSFVNLYRLLAYLKQHRIPTVVTNHAEFFYTGSCDHANDCDRWMTGCGNCPQKYALMDRTHHFWKKMRAAFSGHPNLVVTSVSPWVLSRATASPILEGVRQELVLNGVDTDIFYPRQTPSLWQRYGIDPQGRQIVLYVTACFYGDRPEKGSEYLLRLSEAMPDVLFVVAGDHAAGLTVPDNVRLLGRISDQQELARLYSAADLTLITSRRETFSMPVAESLCCGTPVVGFQAGGPESIALPDYASFAAFGDVPALKELVNTALSTPHDPQTISTAATTKYNKHMMATQYIAIYDQLTEAAQP